MGYCVKALALSPDLSDRCRHHSRHDLQPGLRHDSALLQHGPAKHMCFVVLSKDIVKQHLLYCHWLDDCLLACHTRCHKQCKAFGNPVGAMSMQVIEAQLTLLLRLSSARRSSSAEVTDELQLVGKLVHCKASSYCTALLSCQK